MHYFCLVGPVAPCTLVIPDVDDANTCVLLLQGKISSKSDLTQVDCRSVHGVSGMVIVYPMGKLYIFKVLQMHD